MAERPRINYDDLKAWVVPTALGGGATFDEPGHPAQEGDAGLGGVS
jgi:hypothetical protein